MSDGPSVLLTSLWFTLYCWPYKRYSTLKWKDVFNWHQLTCCHTDVTKSPRLSLCVLHFVPSARASMASKSTRVWRKTCASRLANFDDFFRFFRGEKMFFFVGNSTRWPDKIRTVRMFKPCKSRLESDMRPYKLLPIELPYFVDVKISEKFLNRLWGYLFPRKGNVNVQRSSCQCSVENLPLGGLDVL